MKKKNTGVEESNQGHRAKMNSSDRSGLDLGSADGWTMVVSKRSQRMLRKSQQVEEPSPTDSSNERSKRQARRRSRSNSSRVSDGNSAAADVSDAEGSLCFEPVL